MNRKTVTVVNLILFAIWLLVACILTVYAYRQFNFSNVDVIAYSLTGLLVNYLLTIAIHEIGHIICAKICKMKVARVNFGPIEIDYTQNKKVKCFSRISLEGGESNFIPTKPVTKGQLRFVAFGGLFFTLLFAVACNIPMMISVNKTAFCFLTIGSCAAFYLFTVNLLPFDKTSDGTILLTNREYIDVIVAVLNHQFAVQKNGIPEESVIFKRSKEPLAVYFHFVYLILQHRKEEAYRDLLALSHMFYTLTDEEYTAIFTEILYEACQHGVLDDEIKNRADIFFTEENNTPSFLRAHCAYRKHQGEKEWACSIYKSYKKALSQSPAFIKEYESRYALHVDSRR